MTAVRGFFARPLWIAVELSLLWWVGLHQFSALRIASRIEPPTQPNPSCSRQTCVAVIVVCSIECGQGRPLIELHRPIRSHAVSPSLRLSSVSSDNRENSPAHRKSRCSPLLLFPLHDVHTELEARPSLRPRVVDIDPEILDMGIDFLPAGFHPHCYRLVPCAAVPAIMGTHCAAVGRHGR